MAQSVADLKTVGLSLRKAEYVRGLGEHFISGHLSNEALMVSSDAVVREKLIQVRGLGPWSVDMFLLFALKRPDILPVGAYGLMIHKLI